MTGILNILYTETYSRQYLTVSFSKHNDQQEELSILCYDFTPGVKLLNDTKLFQSIQSD